MSKKILFVIEGPDDEINLLITSFKAALNISNEEIEIYKHKSHIYSLYNEMINEGYESFLTFLYSKDKSIFPNNNDFITPEDAFASVYLLFDLDPQSKDLKHLNELCDFFYDETQNGKLYLSVPMVQSIYDFDCYKQDSFNKKVYEVSRLSKNYKRESRENSFLAKKYRNKSFSKIKEEDILQITLLNMMKYRYLANKPFSLEWKEASSAKETLLIEKPFLDKGLVSVLCGGILLIPDYSPILFGNLMSKTSKRK